MKLCKKSKVTNNYVHELYLQQSKVKSKSIDYSFISFRKQLDRVIKLQEIFFEKPRVPVNLT
jgi:hypothetical protein